jgi:hypothetical protein
MDQGGKGTIKWTRLSSRSFAGNAARSPTILATSCARWRRRSRSKTGRSRVCARDLCGKDSWGTWTSSKDANPWRPWRSSGRDHFQPPVSLSAHDPGSHAVRLITKYKPDAGTSCVFLGWRPTSMQQGTPRLVYWFPAIFDARALNFGGLGDRARVRQRSLQW